MGTCDTGAAPLTRGATISQWELKSTSFPGSQVSPCYISVPPLPSPSPPSSTRFSLHSRQEAGTQCSTLPLYLPASQSLPCNPSFTACLWVCVWLSTAHSNSGYVTQKTMQKAYFILCLQGSMDFFYYYYFLLSLIPAAHTVDCRIAPLLRVHNLNVQIQGTSCIPLELPKYFLFSPAMFALVFVSLTKEENLKSLWLFESVIQIARAGEIKMVLKRWNVWK